MSEITQILQEVTEKMCNEYCRFLHDANLQNMSDEEFEDFTDKYCDKCPLNRIS